MHRRTLLIGSAAVVGGFVIGYRQLNSASDNPLQDFVGEDQIALTPYIVIDQSGITLIAPRAEMGQGIHTTLAALVAEEFDVELAAVSVIHGPASEVYRNHVAYPAPAPHRAMAQQLKSAITREQRSYGTQLTGGQSSIQDAFQKMRIAGAAARLVLLNTAAREMDADVSVLHTDAGYVIGPSATKISYADLAAKAIDIEVPVNPPLKAQKDWKILGRSQHRVDMNSKCTGTAEFASDVQVEDLLYATPRMSPRLGGTINTLDTSVAASMPGVVKVVQLGSGVIVVATNTWYAMEAAKAIDVQWSDAPYPAHGVDHQQLISAAFDSEHFFTPREDGDVQHAIDRSNLYSGEYRVPYLAHAPMEPLSATALLKGGQLTIWAGTQNPSDVRYKAAALAGIDALDVQVNTTFMGGGFGRRLEFDFVSLAVQAAIAVEGRPIQVFWSRDEDMTHDVYRPMAEARFEFSLLSGQIHALDIQVASPSLFASLRSRNGSEAQGEALTRFDKFVSAGVSEQPYQIPHYRVRQYQAENLLPVGWWRSVGESQNSFFHESIIDEIAVATAKDPFDMRLDLLQHPHSRAVLQQVAELSSWGSELPPSHYRGVAFVLSSGAPTAQVVEIVSTGSAVEVKKVYVVVDVGIALNPDTIVAQVQSSVIFGLTAAIFGKITVADGRVEQTNFDQYQLLRMHNTPEIVVGIYENGETIFGVGESGTPATAPALGNAIFAATGQRIREMPFADAVNFRV